MPVKCGGELGGSGPGVQAGSSLGQKSTAPSCFSQGEEGLLVRDTPCSWVSPGPTGPKAFLQEVPISRPKPGTCQPWGSLAPRQMP